MNLHKFTYVAMQPARQAHVFCDNRMYLSSQASLCNKHCNHMCCVIIDMYLSLHMSLCNKHCNHMCCVFIGMCGFTYVAVQQALQPHVLCKTGAANNGGWSGSAMAKRARVNSEVWVSPGQAVTRILKPNPLLHQEQTGVPPNPIHRTF